MRTNIVTAKRQSISQSSLKGYLILYSLQTCIVKIVSAGAILPVLNTLYGVVNSSLHGRTMNQKAAKPRVYRAKLDDNEGFVVGRSLILNFIDPTSILVMASVVNIRVRVVSCELNIHIFLQTLVIRGYNLCFWIDLLNYLSSKSIFLSSWSQFAWDSKFCYSIAQLSVSCCFPTARFYGAYCGNSMLLSMQAHLSPTDL